MSDLTRRGFLHRSTVMGLGLTVLSGRAGADNERSPVPRPGSHSTGKKYRVAVIGRQGRYGHGLDVVWKTVDNVEIVAVADDNEKGRAEAARAARGEERLRGLPGDAGEGEAADRQRGRRLPRRSTGTRWSPAPTPGPSMFLEKPMCRTLVEADEMVQACEKHHVKLAIAHQTRYSPRVQQIREMIAGGRLGDLLELRGRGKEDARGGGQDLMVLGTHVMDLMRFLAGDARWCFATVLQDGKPADEEPTSARAARAWGRSLGDHIQATYGFDKGVQGTFGTHRAKAAPASASAWRSTAPRAWCRLTTGSLPAAYFLDDPSWFPGRSKVAWQEITSAGVGKPEPLKDGGLGLGNCGSSRT